MEENRQTGRTTRLVDFYIQELYNNSNKEIIIKDHYENNESNRYLLSRIKYRLEKEHIGDSFRFTITSITYNKK